MSALDFAYLPPQPSITNGNGAQPTEPAALAFVSAAELRSATPTEPPWIWQDYLARGTVALIAGKPKSGKSTLVCSLIEAIAASAPTFLGRRITAGAVVYISEEGAGTLAPKLPASDRVRVLTRDAAWPKPSWPDLIGAAIAEAQRVGAGVIVIDSFAFWAAFTEGQENDPSAAQAVMNALAAATSAGLAVGLVHHQRKGGGEDGDAVRGTGAIFGSVDVLVELERLGGDAPPSQRRLVAAGRWTTTPAVLVVDRDAATGAWRTIGEAAGRDEAQALGYRERILHAAPSEEPGAKEGELATLTGIDGRRLSGPLRDLLDEGLIARTGGGRKGDPYLYRIASEDSPQDAPLAPGSIAPEMLPLYVVGEHPNSDSPRGEPQARGESATEVDDDRAERLLIDHADMAGGGS